MLGEGCVKRSRLIRVLFNFAVFSGLILLNVPAAAMSVYKVQRGDSLWRIAEQHSLPDVSTAQLVQSIKGINAKDHQGIMQNEIQAGAKLSIPTQKNEFKDGQKVYQSLAFQHAKEHQNNDQAKKNQTKSQSKEDQSAPKPSHDQQGSVTSHSVKPASDDSVEVNQQTSDNQINQTPTVRHSSVRGAEPVDVHSSFRWWWLIVLIIAGGLLLKKRQKKQEIIQRKNQIKNRYYGLSTDANVVQTSKSTTNVAKKQSKTQTKKRLGKYSAKQKQMLKNVVQKVAAKSKNKKAINLASQRVRSVIPMDQINKAEEIEQIIKRAETHIQNRHLDQAKSALQDALNLSPRDINVRMKMLEVYALDQDMISFNSEREYLASKLLSYDDEHWATIEQIYHEHFGRNKHR